MIVVMMRDAMTAALICRTPSGKTWTGSDLSEFQNVVS